MSRRVKKAPRRVGPPRTDCRDEASGAARCREGRRANQRRKAPESERGVGLTRVAAPGSTEASADRLPGALPASGALPPVPASPLPERVRISAIGRPASRFLSISAMPEAVIVATARSPIGRAFKGSLKEVRPDDLAAQIVKALLAKVPQLDPGEIEDLMLGNGQPAGEAGFNIARVVAILSGLDNVPGVTVNRYCSSSLQTIRMAAHAIKAGEGDVFVAAGVETTSRFFAGSSDGVPNTHNLLFAEAEARSAKRSDGGQPPWEPQPGLPDIYIAMGQTAENVAEYENVSRGDGRVLSPVAEPGGRARGERLLRARDHPGHPSRRHRGVEGRRAAARHDCRRPREAPAGVPARWPDHRRERLPAQRRRGCGPRHERPQGFRARARASRPCRLARA